MPNDIYAEITSAGEIVVEISGMTYGSVEAQLALVNADITALETGKADNTTVEALNSEVILARGAKPTLGARLDADKAEVSAQLAETVKQSADLENLFPVNPNAWINGTLSSGVPNYVNQAQRLIAKNKIKVENGIPYLLAFADTTMKFWVELYNAQGVYLRYINWLSANATMTFDADVEYIRPIVAFVASANISPSDMSSGKIKLRKSLKSAVAQINNQINTLTGANKIRLMNANYGLWYDGITLPPADQIEAIGYKYRKMLAEHNCDIVMGQEHSLYMDAGNTINAYTYLFSHKYANLSRLGFNQSVITNKTLISPTFTIFSNETFRGFMKTHVDIGGKNVCLINAHLAIESDPTIKRNAQIAQLITAMNAEQYVILTGDFNAYTKAEYDAFKTAGYKLGNGGLFGWFDTWHNLDRVTTWEQRAIDNIIVSNNINIENVFMDDKRLSDHAPLIADLTIN